MSMKANAAPALTLLVFAVIAIAVLITTYQYFLKPAKERSMGFEVKGPTNIKVQELLKRCSFWKSADFMDTVQPGVAELFSDLQLNQPEPHNLICKDEQQDYEACAMKCAAALELSKYCQAGDERCYAGVSGRGGLPLRCYLEGCRNYG